METIQNKQIDVIKTLKYPDGCDSIDKAIIDIINSSENSMSINTLRNQFLRQAMRFDERLERLSKICSGLKLWEKKKPTLQIGTEAHKKKSEEENE